MNKTTHVELKPGVYRHYKGDYYLVLWVAKLLEGRLQKDQDAHVFVDPDDGGYWVSPASETGDIRLLTARSHGDYARGDLWNPSIELAVYVPLYSSKPGRRISVRAVSEFAEEICSDCGVVQGTMGTPEGAGRLVCKNPDGLARHHPKGPDAFAHAFTQRFTYVGDTIPETK